MIAYADQFYNSETTFNSGTTATASHYDDDYVVITHTDTPAWTFPISPDDFMRLANAEASKWILRIGMFIEINPPKIILSIIKRYWRKIIRCNRHGLGLRIRMDK